MAEAGAEGRSHEIFGAAGAALVRYIDETSREAE
jgi:hypothetical protein